MANIRFLGSVYDLEDVGVKRKFFVQFLKNFTGLKFIFLEQLEQLTQNLAPRCNFSIPYVYNRFRIRKILNNAHLHAKKVETNEFSDSFAFLDARM